MTKNEYNKAYHAKNREKIQERKRIYREENEEIISLKHKARYKEKKELKKAAPKDDIEALQEALEKRDANMKDLLNLK